MTKSSSLFVISFIFPFYLIFLPCHSFSLKMLLHFTPFFEATLKYVFNHIYNHTWPIQWLITSCRPHHWKILMKLRSLNIRVSNKKTCLCDSRECVGVGKMCRRKPKPDWMARCKLSSIKPSGRPAKTVKSAKSVHNMHVYSILGGVWSFSWGLWEEKMEYLMLSGKVNVDWKHVGTLKGFLSLYASHRGFSIRGLRLTFFLLV